MSDWSLRLARPADAECLPAIEQAAATLFRTLDELGFVADMPPMPPERHRRYIVRGHCLVAETDGTPIGFVVTQPVARELHIREMSVHPDWQGRGIGSVLLRALEIDARNSGFAALALTTFRDVAWNAPFYAGHGFVEVSDPATHPALARALADEAAAGLPADRRVAMIRFLG